RGMALAPRPERRDVARGEIGPHDDAVRVSHGYGMSGDVAAIQLDGVDRAEARRSHVRRHDRHSPGDPLERDADDPAERPHAEAIPDGVTAVAQELREDAHPVPALLRL